MERTAALSQPRYFRVVLASEWELKNVLCWERGCAFIFMGNKKLWTPSKLITIRFDLGRPPEKSWLQT